MLQKGENAFTDCIEYLEACKPMEPLELNDNIIIKVPKDNKLHDKSIMDEKKNELVATNSFNFIALHYDNGYINAEISALLQIVDDNNSLAQRRKNIFNKDYKYLGVSVNKIKPGRYISYFSFAG